jgi:hypothetical protein
MATLTDFETVLRRVLNEGTARGQRNWSGTSKATLAAIQHVANLINQQVLPPLDALVDAQGGGVLAIPTAPEDPATALSVPLTIDDEEGLIAEEYEQIEDAGVQQLDQAETEVERQAAEATLLVETDNGPHDDVEEVSQELEVGDDNG